MRSDSSHSASSSCCSHGFEVVRAIAIRGAVHVTGAGGFEKLEVAVFGSVFRLLKHHVLEEVRKARASG